VYAPLPGAAKGTAMADILEGLTPLRVLPKTIEAACYNRVRLALLRNGPVLRIAVPRHSGLEIMVTDQAWLCVDTTRNDQPVLAWSEFQVSGRRGLHEAVRCRLSLYHIQAGLVMGSALEALAEGEWESP
jgi:hypothetical protein